MLKQQKNQDCKKNTKNSQILYHMCNLNSYIRKKKIQNH